MTKQIKSKDGKILKIERCGECLVKPAIIPGFCPLSNKPVYAGHSIRDDCPLEEWQERGTTKEDICTMLCPDCHTLIHIESCSVIAEKDAEIAELNEEIEKQNYIIDKQDRRATEFERGAKKRILDLEKALQEAREYDPFVCPRRQDACIDCAHTACPQRIEKAIPPKDEPELWICPKAELCCQDDCVHKKPHQRINHETGMNNCNRPGKCGGRTECIPYKEPTVPQIQQPARRENTVAGALYQAIEVEGRRIDAYAKKQVNFDMRLDKLEKEIAAIREKE